MREERRGGLNKRDCRISGVQPADSTAQCNAVGRLAQGMQHSPHSGTTECGIVDAEDAQLSLCLPVRIVLATPHYSHCAYSTCSAYWSSTQVSISINISVSTLALAMSIPMLCPCLTSQCSPASA